ncbi:MAG TPA: hypothetical protein VF600_11070 [Abditibacteriaceae bacterium]|jgi:hypothetical protein
MQTPTNHPPIPTPDGSYVPAPALSSGGDWKAAPKIVKNWAYQLTWLAIVLLPIVVIAAVFTSPMPAGEAAGLILFYSVLWAVNIWLNRSLKKGAPAAWVTQIVISVLGLLAFPIGTLIHGYVLSQWFKPETKAWFGRS